MFRRWQAITLWKRVLIGLALGAALGLLLHYGLPDYPPVNQIDAVEQAEPLAGVEKVKRIGNERASRWVTIWFKPFGEAFIRLIQMLIVPLITTTIIAGVTSLGDPKKLGSIGIKAMFLFLITSFFAVWLGLGVGSLLKPGAGIHYQDATADVVSDVKDKLATAQRSGSITDQLLAIIPRNPVDSLARGEVLPIIFFAIVLGIGIVLSGEVASPVRLFFDSAAQIVLKITLMVMELAPFGVFALMVWVMGTQGISILTNLFWLVVALYAACLIHIFLVYGLVLIKGIGRLPVRAFFRSILDAQGVAFSLSSSSATLPVSISCAQKNLGVHKSVADSVLPLGATVNMDGTSIYLGLVTLFGAQAAGLELSWETYLNVAITATLISVGVAGIPSASLFFAATLLGSIGLDPTQSALVVAFIFPFDRILDMMRTLTNITGDLAVTSVVAKWEGAIDENIFKSPNVISHSREAVKPPVAD
jgi:Na+/H+-dicarboxylate symporter